MTLGQFYCTLFLVFITPPSYVATQAGRYRSFTVSGFPSERIAAKYGLKVAGDVPPSQFKNKRLRFVPFLEEGEMWVDGPEMVFRAEEKKANLSLLDGWRMMHHRSTQKKFWGIRYRCWIVLAGTLLMDAGGRFHVACLWWDGCRWTIEINPLDYRWYKSACLAGLSP